MNPNLNPENPSHSNDFAKAAEKVGDKAADLAQSAKEGIKSAGETLYEKGAAAASAAGEAASKVGSRLRSAAETVQDKAGEVFHDLGEGASDLYRRASAKARTLGEDGVEFVRENPTATVLTALAAGVILGYTLRR